MNNLAVLPIILPLIAGFTTAFFVKKPTITRFLTKFFISLNLLSVVYIVYYVFTNGSIVLETGSWEAPYGIIFIADPLSILLVLTTNILATACAFIAPHFVPEKNFSNASEFPLTTRLLCC